MEKDRGLRPGAENFPKFKELRNIGGEYCKPGTPMGEKGMKKDKMDDKKSSY